MCTPSRTERRPGRGARAFTLLEVMIAVLIISMLMFSVFRFVKSVLLAVQVSTEATVTKQEMTGFISFLQTQLEDLPPGLQRTVLYGSVDALLNAAPTPSRGATFQNFRPLGALPNSGNDMSPPLPPGVLTGTSHNYHDLPADEMDWVCPAGHGILTAAGSGQYRVTLAIQNAKGKTNDYEIGLRRRTVDSDERNYDWLPLLRPAAGLELRYFEPRGQQWIEAWQDPVTRPALVRVRVWRNKSEPPYEAVLALPSARLQ